jgi:hypothetical protein
MNEFGLRRDKAVPALQFLAKSQLFEFGEESTMIAVGDFQGDQIEV